MTPSFPVMGELRVRRHDLDGVEGVPLHTSEQDAEAYRVNVIVWRAGQQSTYVDGCWTARLRIYSWSTRHPVAREVQGYRTRSITHSDGFVLAIS